MTEANPEGLLWRRVPPADAACRLDVFLGRQPEIGSRSLAKALILEGLVRVDDFRGKPGLELEVGQVVCFSPRLEPEALAIPDDQLPPLSVLHEDSYILVVDKPPGLAVHPPKRSRVTPPALDLSYLAVRRCGPLPTLGGEDRPGIVHRLDKDTSGVIVLAKCEEAFHFLQSQFKARTVRKEYRALCYGDPRFDSDWIDRNIAIDARSPDRMAVVNDGGKEANTFYEVIERFGGVAYVRCLPKTGRTHQIRVHMASIGHSLVGDRVYRPQRASVRLPEGAPDPGRHCLHALRLEFLHPRTHEPMAFDAPMPADMAGLLTWLQQRPR